jgi:hypothetical protein
VEFIGQALDRAPRTGDDGGTLGREYGTDTGADTAHAAGDQNDATHQTEVQ